MSQDLALSFLLLRKVARPTSLPFTSKATTLSLVRRMNSVRVKTLRTPSMVLVVTTPGAFAVPRFQILHPMPSLVSRQQQRRSNMSEYYYVVVPPESFKRQSVLPCPVTIPVAYAIETNCFLTPLSALHLISTI
mmetsp:Transcript_673/g.1164  ORF Transcript_673/g.1164 Transcript_673/m.1164 type:complete len:134 (+) Transcript_673:411-812(+)